MDRATARRIERLVEASACLCVAAAVAFALYRAADASLSEPVSAGIAALGAAIAYLAARGVLSVLGAAGASREWSRVEAKQEADELLLVDVYAPPERDSRVVELFQPGRRALAAGPGEQDSTEAFHEALRNLRRTLR